MSVNKIFNTFKGWEDDTQQNVGLLTLYQQKNPIQSIESKQTIKANKRKEVRQSKKDLKYQRSHKQTIGYQLGSLESRRRYKTPEIYNRSVEQYDEKRQHFSTIKRRQRKNHLINDWKVIINQALEKKQKRVIKKGYYDVGKMGAILSCRSDNITPLYKVNHSDKSYTSPGQQIPNNQETPQGEMAAINKKQKVKRQAYIKSIRNLLDRSQMPVQSLQQLNQPQSLIKFRLLNFDAAKIKKKNNDFRAIFKKQLNSLSQRYKASSIQVECCSSQLKEADDSLVLCGSSKRQLRMREMANKHFYSKANTISNKSIGDNVVRDLVEISFTKAHKEKRRRGQNDPYIHD